MRLTLKTGCAVLGLATVAWAAPDGGHETTVRAVGTGVKSAQAVTVVDLAAARDRAQDLGEVLARTPGVSLQRTGGLGSSTQLSLHGLSDDQVRVFLDGVPIHLTGIAVGLGNVPVTLLDRVEVFRGVVPLRFGADALGGAVELVSRQRSTSGLGLSAQVGSFGTHRYALEGRWAGPNGVALSGGGFFDAAVNDYLIDVQETDAQGRVSDARVRRFHDGYRAGGGWVEASVEEVPWASRASLRLFGATAFKALQHNLVMTVPWGEPTTTDSTLGGLLRWGHRLGAVELDAAAAFSQRFVSLRDVGRGIYDWRGREVGTRVLGGELSGQPIDQLLRESNLWARAWAQWAPAPGHVLRASVTPTAVRREQADARSERPALGPQGLVNLVGGVEYELSRGESDAAWRRVVHNVLFLKGYFGWADGARRVPGGVERLESLSGHFGLGDSLRLRLARWLQLKASYEYATRLPRPDERFGDGVFISANPGLEPEVSHNTNLGARVELDLAAAGWLTLDATLVWREADRLIVLLSDEWVAQFSNVYRARVLGGDASLRWSSPRGLVTVEGGVTGSDVRNVSDSGPFAAFSGARVPNKPWLQASWSAQLQWGGVFFAGDRVVLFYVGRFVAPFYRGWEGQGLVASKQQVPAQHTHGLGATWAVPVQAARLTVTAEGSNLLDARVYDVFGAQRPGRAFFVKLGVEL